MSTPSQEDRLQAVEDRLAIYTLIASHPPSADTAAANYTHEVYTEDCVFDRGPKLEGAKGEMAMSNLHLFVIFLPARTKSRKLPELLPSLRKSDISVTIPIP